MSQPSYLPGGFTVAVLRYEWHCFGCEQVGVEQHRPYGPQHQIPNPSMPEGWREIDKKFYCPKHTLSVLVDGKLIS